MYPSIDKTFERPRPKMKPWEWTTLAGLADTPGIAFGTPSVSQLILLGLNNLGNKRNSFLVKIFHNCQALLKENFMPW